MNALDRLGASGAKRWGLVWVLLLVVGTCPAWADTHERVAVLLSAGGDTYRLIAEELAFGLADTPVEISVFTLSEEEKAPALIARLSDGKFDLVVAIGTSATQYVSRNAPAVPLLAIYIPQHSYRTIFQQYPHTARRSAIFLDQPLNRQFALIRVLLPGYERVGVLLSEHSQQEFIALQEAAAIHNMDVHIVEVNDGEDPVDKMKRVVDESDVLLVVPEPRLLNPTRAKWLLYHAYRHSKPVIAYSRSFVTAGALAAIYSEPVQVGAEAADVIRRYFADEGFPEEEGIYPQRYSASSNGFVARSLGARLYDEQQLKDALEGEVR